MLSYMNLEKIKRREILENQEKELLKSLENLSIDNAVNERKAEIKRKRVNEKEKEFLKSVENLSIDSTVDEKERVDERKIETKRRTEVLNESYRQVDQKSQYRVEL